MSQGDGGSARDNSCAFVGNAIDRIAMYAAQGRPAQDFDVTHAHGGRRGRLHRATCTGTGTPAGARPEIREVTGFNGTRATSHLVFSAPYPACPLCPR